MSNDTEILEECVVETPEKNARYLSTVCWVAGMRNNEPNAEILGRTPDDVIERAAEKLAASFDTEPTNANALAANNDTPAGLAALTHLREYLAQYLFPDGSLTPGGTQFLEARVAYLENSNRVSHWSSLHNTLDIVAKPDTRGHLDSILEFVSSTKRADPMCSRCGTGRL